jgi:mRNA interferase YafQ
MSHLETVIRILSEEGQLPVEYKPHILSGKYAGIWECHVEPDWLLLWTQNDKELILLLLDTGTHSDIF